LAKAGSPIEEPSDTYGNRPLHIAARLGHATAIEALLSLGADPSGPNAHGATPLDMASYGEGAKFDKSREMLAQAGGRRAKTQEGG
jgi:ankyrin repeat protein